MSELLEHQYQELHGKRYVLLIYIIGQYNYYNIQWIFFQDGVNVGEQPGLVSIWTEGGGSVLEIARASSTDAGWYQCTAQNTAGSTATRARLNVIRKSCPQDFPEDRRLRLPKPTRVIEPE